MIPVSEVHWQDLLELHAVKKLKQIVERRFRVALGFVDARGQLMGGPSDGADCVAQAIGVARGNEGAHALAYSCATHMRRELVAPIRIEGAFFGCVFATAA